MIELKEVVEKCTEFLKLELHESNAIGKYFFIVEARNLSDVLTVQGYTGLQTGTTLRLSQGLLSTTSMTTFIWSVRRKSSKRSTKIFSPS